MPLENFDAPMTSSRRNVIRVAAGLVMAILAMLALPFVLKPKLSAARNVCVDNLLLIQQSKQLWAKAQGKKPTDVPNFADLIHLGRDLKRAPTCPSHGEYIIGAVGEKPRCTSGLISHRIDAN